MKKLVFLFLSLLTAGSLFQACDNSKTYAEMLEDEKNAVNKFIKDNDIRVISLEEFERDTVTASKEAGDGYDHRLPLEKNHALQRTADVFSGTSGVAQHGRRRRGGQKTAFPFP